MVVVSTVLDSVALLLTDHVKSLGILPDTVLLIYKEAGAISRTVFFQLHPVYKL